MKFLALLLLIPLLSIQEIKDTSKPAYIIYSKEGKEVTYSKLLKTALQNKVILFGESHDNPIAHWLQFELAIDLYNYFQDDLIIGAEMFESDNQFIIDEYLKNQISENSFQNEVRLWPNYNTDYKPLIELSKTQKIPFIATNIPRRYASMVYHKGIESLYSIDSVSRKYICPLPLKVDTTLSQYKSLLHAGSHGGTNMLYAQAIKDATMAYFIEKNSTENSVFLHLNGSYHSDYYQGIKHYLEESSIGSKIMTISTVSQKDITYLNEENRYKADFIIVVPNTMTKTH